MYLAKRKLGEGIVIDDQVTVYVSKVYGDGQVLLAVDAPKTVPIRRLEEDETTRRVVTQAQAKEST